MNFFQELIKVMSPPTPKEKSYTSKIQPSTPKKEIKESTIYDKLLEIYCKKKNIDRNNNLLKKTFEGFGQELILLIIQCLSDDIYEISKIDGHLIRKDNMTQEEWARENGLRIVYE